jgi:hypothetical protein
MLFDQAVPAELAAPVAPITGQPDQIGRVPAKRN